ncbi:hypothetical protein BDA96_01G371600 [Sorghum bicolor]|jgi:hypothetical protein|uniref:Secreted protein n=2 Tax=Sorghum bicolor TaxID=4558 RepID=A0A921S3C6_SORBI|nr:hypothetical protein BDA96_01G371600 [Sorghum bicolor]KXG39212.1 hypothetical protein SORBI_3001G348300 [Sorghum bicolor]
MAIQKSYNNMSTVAVMVVVLVLTCQVMSAHCTPTMILASTPRRYLLAVQSSASTASATKAGMMEGTITPAEGGVPGATEDVRPTNPSHSPGIGHAFTHSRIGRKLLTTQ